MGQILIYTESINPRKQYIFNHIFHEILGVEYSFCTDLDYFKSANQCKFTYTFNKIDNYLFFPVHQFMNQVNIIDQLFETVNVDHITVPFKVENGDFFSFDVFSTSFFLLSRYEEYLNRTFDKYGRYSAKQSLAYKFNFLQKPMVDIWAKELFYKLEKHYPKLAKKNKKFECIATIDIDEPFYFYGNNLKSNLKKLLKLVYWKGFSSLFNDPYNVYQYLEQIHKKYNLQLIYFFLLGNVHQLDNAPVVNFEGGKYQKLIKKLASTFAVGIHPSFNSNSSNQILKSEINLLKCSINKPVELSRQHYLKLSIPETYQNLINQGIRNDFTMGYADALGFRASTCTPFFWYDLQNEIISDLKIFPFAVMDQTLKSYLKLKKEQAIEQTLKLMHEVYLVKGTFITLWHNESVSDYGFWKGWRIVYEEILKAANDKQFKR